jgi:hypothetical protein
MTPVQSKRTEFSRETEDLALLFIEEEVGRFDWKNNWPKIRAAGVARQRIEAWLQALKSNHDPEEIIEFLDWMVQQRSGRWL